MELYESSSQGKLSTSNSAKTELDKPVGNPGLLFCIDGARQGVQARQLQKTVPVSCESHVRDTVLKRHDGKGRMEHSCVEFLGLE